MATATAVVAAIDDALQPTGVGAKYWRDRLATARLIDCGQGRPLDTPLTDVAVILLAVMIGKRAAAQPALAVEYAALKSTEGFTLGDILARYLADPHDLLELAIDNSTPAAAIRHRDKTGGVVETLFLPAIVSPREGFARVSHLDANGFTQLALAIRNAAPAPRKRRRRRGKTNP